MYAPLPAARNRRAGFAAGAPILAICCLGFILFLIAATIVLALIPVYLSKRSGGSSSSMSPRYQFVLTPNPAAKRQTSYTPPAGSTLDTASLASIDSELARVLKISADAILIEYGIVASDGTSKVYCPLEFNKQKCSKCGNNGFLESIQSFAITPTIFGHPVSYAVVLILNSNNIPTTSTAAPGSSGSGSSGTGSSGTGSSGTGSGGTGSSGTGSSGTGSSGTGSSGTGSSGTATTAAPGTTASSLSLSFPVPSNLPDGPVDQASYAGIASSLATSMGAPANSIAIDSATVTDSKRRRRRGFGLMRERRGIHRLLLFFHFLLSICPSCGDPAFITKIESNPVTLTATISVGGFAVAVVATGTVVAGSSASATTPISGAVTTATIAGATAKVVG
ncbi:unnamed protein product [Adineta steineri]|uniref:Uncharacterized protein n=1 Tax=Adineta steineri TaxID=433720 RepID=A0A813V509_9BILA|nr:unnamed protein product [Adineta steineri]CAF3721672.1 unnamed protein product [Adineta steineri]